MINQHNPVMQRLGEMAGRWQKEIRPQHRLIRWMLRPEDSRMYEGFCRLEASPHGHLDSLFVFFYTPFLEMETFSHAIIIDWLKEYDDNEEQRGHLAKAGVKGEWDIASCRRAVETNDYTACDTLLPV